MQVILIENYALEAKSILLVFNKSCSVYDPHFHHGGTCCKNFYTESFIQWPVVRLWNTSVPKNKIDISKCFYNLHLISNLIIYYLISIYLIVISKSIDVLYNPIILSVWN